MTTLIVAKYKFSADHEAAIFLFNSDDERLSGPSTEVIEKANKSGKRVRDEDGNLYTPYTGSETGKSIKCYNDRSGEYEN